MEGENVKISINEVVTNSLEKKINNFQINMGKLNEIKKKIDYDLNELKKEFNNLNTQDHTKPLSVSQITESHIPTTRYDIYADVYISNDLCNFLNLPKAGLHRKSEIVFKVFKYIKQNKLSYFGGYFVVDMELRKIFPQNGDYYAKNDKFFKLSNIYKLLSIHLTRLGK
jgi:hypothetical protein